MPGTLRIVGIEPYLEREGFSREVGALFSEDDLYKRQTVLWNLRF